MSEERRPSLPWISWVLKPSLSVGTRKQARPRCFLAGSVWAKISATSAKLPSEIHIFWPLIDQPRVGLGRPGSQVGGVRAGVGLGQAEAAEGLARAEPRQPARFCSSVPQRSIEPATSDVCTETTVRAEESARPTCSTISP